MLPTDPNNQQITANPQQTIDNNQLVKDYLGNQQSAISNQQLVNNSSDSSPQNDVIAGNNLPVADFGAAPAVSSPGLGDPLIQSTKPLSDDPVVAARNQPLSGPFDPLNDDLMKPDTAPVNDDFSAGLQKERELLQKQEQKYIEEIGKEIELEKELKEAGVEKIGEEIELPEMIKKEGIEKVEPEIKLPNAPSQTVPLTRVKIKKALHEKVSEAVLWLAYWCMRQLKIQNKKSDKN